MSIYGPRLRLPKLRLPDFSFPQLSLPQLNAKKIGIILLLILIFATILFGLTMISNFNSPIAVSWKNNPLYLTETNNFSELTLLLTNTSENTTNITLDVSSESKELIIFCPENEFPNVSVGKYRQTTCILRRNPNEKIFTGTYEILIKTNLGETTTTLEIKK